MRIYYKKISFLIKEKEKIKNNKPHKRKSDGMDANNDDINFGKKKGIKYPKKYPK